MLDESSFQAKGTGTEDRHIGRFQILGLLRRLQSVSRRPCISCRIPRVVVITQME